MAKKASAPKIPSTSSKWAKSAIPIAMAPPMTIKRTDQRPIASITRNGRRSAGAPDATSRHRGASGSGSLRLQSMAKASSTRQPTIHGPQPQPKMPPNSHIPKRRPIRDHPLLLFPRQRIKKGLATPVVLCFPHPRHAESPLSRTLAPDGSDGGGDGGRG